MLSAIEAFRENIQRVQSLGVIYQALSASATITIDSSDLLRAQVVLAVSALDHYVHEAARLGMLEIFDGNRLASAAYRRFRVSLECVKGDYTIGRSDLESEIRVQHGFLAFQHPDKIADAIRYFSDIKLWQILGEKLAMEPNAIKQQLRLCIERRNKIAHEADLDPTYPRARWPISVADVNGVIDFISKLVEAIHLSVS